MCALLYSSIAQPQLHISTPLFIPPYWIGLSDCGSLGGNHAYVIIGVEVAVFFMSTIILHQQLLHSLPPREWGLRISLIHTIYIRRYGHRRIVSDALRRNIVAIKYQEKPCSFYCNGISLHRMSSINHHSTPFYKMALSSLLL